MEIMPSNEGATSLISHPLQATAEVIGSMGLDPRVTQKASFFMGANEGPAEVAAKISGLKAGGKREDDGPYFTNNEGIPWPDPLVARKQVSCSGLTRVVNVQSS